MKLSHHGPQDYQSLLMHREAVRMLQEYPELVAKVLEILTHWDEHVSANSRPLRDRWAQIIEGADWFSATEDSERGNQLRRASPLACLLPYDVRLGSIRHVRSLRQAAVAQGQTDFIDVTDTPDFAKKWTKYERNCGRLNRRRMR